MDLEFSRRVAYLTQICWMQFSTPSLDYIVVLPNIEAIKRYTKPELNDPGRVIAPFPYNNDVINLKLNLNVFLPNVFDVQFFCHGFWGLPNPPLYPTCMLLKDKYNPKCTESKKTILRLDYAVSSLSRQQQLYCQNDVYFLYLAWIEIFSNGGTCI
ncbi:unnamed protein product [Allacma fusca]|uniref:3'-5' exonuclease domain-containing protein n=1 Tax=Allacma fusca TaxID=39272 RepID=A0A8J2KP07_9HEXA|nr:unnamed protein product [Allacma fusca]